MRASVDQPRLTARQGSTKDMDTESGDIDDARKELVAQFGEELTATIERLIDAKLVQRPLFRRPYRSEGTGV